MPNKGKKLNLTIRERNARSKRAKEAWAKRRANGTDKVSASTKAKQSRSMIEYWKKHPERRAALSEANKGFLNELVNEFWKDNEEGKKKLGKRNKKRWADYRDMKSKTKGVRL